VGFFESGIRFDFLGTEILGQFFYNNPVNVVLVIIALVAIIRKRRFMDVDIRRLLLLIGLPLIFLFIGISLFRQTLPHWTGPAYLGLIIIASAYLDDKLVELKRNKLLANSVKVSLLFLLIILILGVGQINFGWIYNDMSSDPKSLGKTDVSLDMYGWEQIGEKFGEFIEEEKASGNYLAGAPVISNRWFPAANLDYYVARPLDMKVLAIGSLERIHKYAWINEIRGGFYYGMDGYYITLSRDFQDPSENPGTYFEKIEAAGTIIILRNDRHVLNAFVFRLKNLERIPDSFK